MLMDYEIGLIVASTVVAIIIAIILAAMIFVALRNAKKNKAALDENSKKVINQVKEETDTDKFVSAEDLCDKVIKGSDEVVLPEKYVDDLKKSAKEGESKDEYKFKLASIGTGLSKKQKEDLRKRPEKQMNALLKSYMDCRYQRDADREEFNQKVLPAMQKMYEDGSLIKALELYASSSFKEDMEANRTKFDKLRPVVQYSNYIIFKIIYSASSVCDLLKRKQKSGIKVLDEESKAAICDIAMVISPQGVEKLIEESARKHLMVLKGFEGAKDFESVCEVISKIDTTQDTRFTESSKSEMRPGVTMRALLQDARDGKIVASREDLKKEEIVKKCAEAKQVIGVLSGCVDIIKNMRSSEADCAKLDDSVGVVCGMATAFSKFSPQGREGEVPAPSPAK